MEKNPNTKLCILKDSYNLFLTNNLEKVTIVELEKACKKIRGTIFYHFKSKQILFEEVVERLFLPSFIIPPHLIGNSKKPLSDFLNLYKSPEERVIENIRSSYLIENPEIRYFNFVSQAYKYYPSFQEKYREIMIREIKFLNSVINKSDSHKSVNDIEKDNIAYAILLMGTGLSFSKSFLPVPELSISNLLKNLYYD